MTTNASPIQIPIQPHRDSLAWLAGRKASELGVVEAHELCATCRGTKVRVPTAEPCNDCEGTGRALAPTQFFPEALRRRGTTGEIIEEPVYFVIPREDLEIQRAQDMAIAHIAAHYKDQSIKTAEQAKERAGEQRFAAKENAALVSLCARNREPPHIPAYTLRTLLDRFTSTTIGDAVRRIWTLHDIWSVNVNYLTDEQFWAMAAEIARVGNASPFVVLDAALRGPFVTMLAAEAMRSRTASSSAGSSAPSTSE